MPVREDAFVGLAPAEESVLARYPADPAAWLSFVNPAGGEGSRAMALATPAAGGRSAEPDVTVLVERWVRRVSWGGDPRRAAARLEIGAGRYAGTELVLVAEGGHVSVEVNLANSGGELDLAQRLRRRLEGRGYGADVTVR
jgi:hypothetical protein